MARRTRDYDEDDVRIRPSRTKQRPRSKERPGHEDAVTAVVRAVDRGRFTCHVAGGGRDVVAMRARELGRRTLVVGDRVGLVGVTDRPDTLARIVRVQDRTSVLRRTADDADPVERVLVANADQLAIVTSLANPEPRGGFIDRCLVAAYDAGITPLLVLTKADLAAENDLIRSYRDLDVPTILTSKEGDLDDLLERLTGLETAFIGPSGVGKSTLVNRLVPEADRATGKVNEVTGRGRHTSSSAVAFPLPDEGWIVDTPGVRSFGLAHVHRDRVLSAFPEILAAAADCPRSCTHDEPDCALDEAVRSGAVDERRLASLRRLLTGLRAAN
jgi:ribosome biogenesis GTPase